MTVRWIRSLDEFRDLRHAWDELVAHSDMHGAFMAHAWFDAWVRHLGDPEALAIASVWADGQLVGLAPLQITRRRLRRVPVRALGFLSSSVAPRCGFLAREPADLDPIFAALCRGRDRDVVLLHNLPAEPPTSARFLEFVRRERSAACRLIEPARRSPYLTCDGDYETYRRSLSKSLRQSVRTAANRLATKGLAHAVQRIIDGDEFAAIFPRLLAISRLSWKGTGGTDLGSRPGLQAFYSDFSRAAPGLFEVWVFLVDGEIVAFDYYLTSHRSVSLIRTDFDPEFEFFSPGNLLRVALLEDLFAREGTWEYDMGGQAYPYKTRWASSTREHHDVVIAGNTARGQLTVTAWHALNALRSFTTAPPGHPQRALDS